MSKQDVIGKRDQDLLTQRDARRLTTIKRRVLRTGKPVKVELPLASRDGTLEFLEGSYVPKFDAQGRTNGVIGYFRNVTERKRTEAALARHEAKRQRRSEFS